MEKAESPDATPLQEINATEINATETWSFRPLIDLLNESFVWIQGNSQVCVENIF